MKKHFPIRLLLYITAISVICSGVANAEQIQHDAEHYVLLEQHSKQWAAEDEKIDEKLADIRKKIGECSTIFKKNTPK